MNAELLDLLRQAGAETGGGWRDVLLLENYAPVPTLPRHTEPRWQRGFNLAILVGRTPAYFVKCRPAHDPVLQRAAATRSALAGHRPGGVSVADARFASSNRISVEVTAFLRGPTFGMESRRAELTSLQRRIASLLASHAGLARIARRECAWLRPPADSMTLEAASVANVAYLQEHGIVEHEAAAALLAALSRSGTVTPLPQHGDLWSQNLLVVHGDVWLIDFEEYGDVQVPLFDDLTLVLATIARRSGGGREGLRRFLSADAEGRAWRRLVRDRAAAERIEPEQLDGILVFYLTQMAAQIHRRGGMTYLRPHRAALSHAAERLLAGARGLFEGGSQ